MPPKKDAKKGGDKKGAELTPEEKMALVEQTLEGEKNNLTVELTFQKDKLKQMREENSVLNGEVTALKSKLNKQAADSDDILTHKQREISQKVERVNGLEARVKELESVLKERDEQIRVLNTERKESQKKLDQAAQLASEKAMLEEAVRRQDAVISKQDEEMKRLKEHLEDMEKQMAEARQENADLALKASGTTKLTILFGEPWLLTRTRHRLHGDIPIDREENTLNHMGLKLMVMYGGVGRGEGTGKDLNVANLETFTWEKAAGMKQSGWRQGHSATALGKNKMVTFGGRRGILLSEVQVLNTDTMKWSTPAVKGTCPAREYHATCSIREKIYVMGGSTGASQEMLTNDIYVLDFDTLQWQATATYGSMVPCPRRGHTMCGWEDERKIWVFGGFDGSRHLNDIYVLETDRLTWSCPSATGLIPPPREGHAAAIVGKYLLIAGGNDGHRHMTDMYALDTETMEWECLNDGSEAGMDVVNLKQRSMYSMFHNNKLYTIKPNREEKLDEIECLEFALPEDIEGMINAKKANEDDHADRLELLDVANTSSTSIEVSWRPPTKNADRVHHYKLMMATNTGVVKEVCQGKYERFKVTGLRANAEYIFCVKAIYDDGKHLWSESKAFQTKYGGGQSKEIPLK